MHSLDEIIAKLYPQKSASEQARLVEICTNTSVDFSEQGWGAITKRDLSSEDVQLRLVRTLYEAQTPGEIGVMEAVLASLEEWSNFTLTFVKFTDEARLFYTNYYALSGCMLLEWFGSARIIFLLNSYFFPLMLLLDDTMYTHVRKYFTRFCEVSSLQEDAAHFAGAIRTNHSMLGPGEKTRTIAAWVDDFIRYQPARSADKMQSFFDEQKRFKSLSQEYQKILRAVLFLYDQLSSGAIWRDIDEFLCVHEPAKGTAEPFDPDAYYLERLEKAKDIEPWLKDHADVIAWLENKPRPFVQKLMVVLKKKIDVRNDTHIHPVLEFMGMLKERGMITTDALYFSEQDGQFHWNEQAFV